LKTGYFITIEGTDGSGKTTQIRLLTDYFASRNQRFITTREPGGTPIGEKIRAILLGCENHEMTPRTETLLYLAARAQHVETVIRPALELGYTVLCDRFLDATLAYQGYARGLGIEELLKINDFGTGGLYPDLTIVLDLAPQAGLIRKKNQGPRDRLEQEAFEFHEKVRMGYHRLAEQMPERVKLVDAKESPESVHKTIVNLIETKIHFKKGALS
jgi:dTMP kinase